MQTIVDIPDHGLTLTCDYHAIYTYAVMMAGQPPVRTLALEQPGTGDPGGRVGLAIPEISYTASLPVTELGPGAAPPPGPGVAPELELENTHARRPVDLEVSWNGRPLARLPLTLLPPWHWSHAPESRIVAAAYVLPGDEIVSRTVIAASGRTPGSEPLVSLVRRDRANAARRVLTALYGYLAGECRIDYETPRMETEERSRQTYQKVRSPQEIFFLAGERRGRGNCFDLSLFLAGCLESLDQKPLIVFTGTRETAPTHAFVGVWLDGGRRFDPVVIDPVRLADAVGAGRLLLLEATGVSRGSMALSVEEAEAAAREHLARGPVHAVDVAACRPPIGRVRPVQLANAPEVQRALWAAQTLAASRRARLYETLHLLYGLCVVGGELTRWVLERSGGEAGKVRRVIERSLPEEASDGVPVGTKNYRICQSTARGNARSEGRSTVEEVDLLWAVVENPSRNVRRVLEAAGCDYGLLVRELDQRCKRPGEMSIHRAVNQDTIR